MKLKNILKKIKLAEPTLSTFFGIFVVVFIGYLIFKYFQGIGKLQKGEAELKPVVSEEATETKGVSRILPTVYQVKEGDHLWKISVEFYGSGYNWVDIAKQNNLKNPDKIFAGDQLKIPEVEERIPVSKPSPNLSVISGNEYKVERGDNLWLISVRAYGDGYKWTKIAESNNLKNPNLIHPGNILKLSR